LISIFIASLFLLFAALIPSTEPYGWWLKKTGTAAFLQLLPLWFVRYWCKIVEWF
jgi:hypothetical protein